MSFMSFSGFCSEMSRGQVFCIPGKILSYTGYEGNADTRKHRGDTIQYWLARSMHGCEYYCATR